MQTLTYYLIVIWRISGTGNSVEQVINTAEHIHGKVPGDTCPDIIRGSNGLEIMGSCVDGNNKPILRRKDFPEATDELASFLCWVGVSYILRMT